MKRELRFVWALGLVLACGACRARSGDDTTMVVGAMEGGDSHDVTAAQTLPARATGWIATPTSTCTATPILRDVIVTAAHCLCDLNNATQKTQIFFHLPHPDSTGAIVDIGPGGGGLQSRDFKLNGSFCGEGAQEPGNSAKDVAVVLLATAITPTDLPTFPAVYTLGDFEDRIFNHPFQTPRFFGGPVQVVGFDGSIPNAPLRKLATVSELEFDTKNVFTTARIDPTGILPFLLGGIDNPNSPGVWIHDPIDAVIPANRLILIRGDSGGPITFAQNETTQTIFGVHSQSWNQTKSWFGFAGAFNSWSPTWDNGAGNGAFVRQFLNDADGDGVSDAIDNCTPPHCNSQGTCNNPDQRDDDMDGIGDACDNCPGFICAVNGGDPTRCANPAQADLDKDGVGDVCDVCPGNAQSPFDFDQNHDGVGNSCDNCPATPTGGGRRACKTDSDCAGKGVCLTGDIHGGRCPSTGTNTACGIFIGFQCSDCTEIGMWGACSEGLEVDTDGDGIGNRCDNCPLFSDAKLQQNSNVPAEVREGAPAANDACDSSPLFTVRPVVEPGGGNGVPRTLFTAFAGVGSDNAAPAPPFNNAPVGFRHCDCPNGSNPDTCLTTTCGTPLAAFDHPDTTPWHLITVGAAPAGSFDESAITPALDFRINDLIYTGGIDCSDPLPHQTRIINLNNPQPPVMTPDRNLCRLGTGTGRLLSWQTNTDVAAGRVASFTAQLPSISGEPQQPALVVQTNGFFWSHGTIPNAARAGNRDTTFSAQLRDNYVHVATPSASTDVIVIPRILVRMPTPGCLQCFKLLSSDWLKALINPGQGLNVLRLLPRPFAIYPDCIGSGTMCAIRRSAEPHIDLSLVFEPDAATNLLDPTRTLVTPTEATPVFAARSGGFVAASVPTSWSQLDSVINMLGDDESGKVGVLQTFAASSPDEGVTPFGGEGFVPSDREGARWIFSKLEQALYMVGGTRNGAPTSEIWRLDLLSSAWKHLFVPINHPQTTVGLVRATAYDAAAGKILIVEDAPGSTPRTARITAFDTRTDTSGIAAILDLSAFSKVGLAATGGGTYILVGAAANSWTAYRFQISAANKITWLGKRTGSGFVVADPLPWQEGPALFTQTGGDLDTTDLTASTFTPGGTPPELSVCDQPLVVPAPPPAVISTCHFPALKAPVPTSVCGPINIDTTAPADFPLGTTTITWTLTDGLGNKATVSQSITAILGDDATCCPAGTNVIMGTSNNDNLVGTAGADCILGLGGQDRISGGGGDDFISGGDGDDIIDGGSGNDRIFGGTGQDTITGGTGNDTIDGGDGDDTCHGGDGNDIIHGGQGQDHLFGENNDDQLFGDDGDDTLDGGPGNDKLNGGGLHDTCIGGTGINTFTQCQTIR